MASSNLTWSVSKDKDWITVIPMQGSGSIDNLIISVSPIESVGDTDTAGTVTITCTSCSKPTSKTISVTRCPYESTECKWSDTPTITYKKQNKTIDGCTTATTITPIYNEHYSILVGDCGDIDQNNIAGEPISITTGENTTGAERVVFPKTAEDEKYNITVIQLPKEGECNCSCTDMIINIGQNITIDAVPTEAVAIGTLMPSNSCIGNIVITLTDSKNTTIYTYEQGQAITDDSKIYWKSEDNKVYVKLTANEDCNDKTFYAKFEWKAGGINCPINSIERRTIKQLGAAKKTVDYIPPTETCEDSGTTIDFNLNE